MVPTGLLPSKPTDKLVSLSVYLLLLFIYLFFAFENSSLLEKGLVIESL